MADEPRTFEELKAEQDAYWNEAAKQPAPSGYAEWVRTQTEEAIRECEQPGAIFFTEDEVNTFMAQRRRQRDSGLLRKAS